MGERQFHTHEFGPYYDENSKILILGSFPSVKSREQQFFYGHPQNRFWRVMSALVGTDVPEGIDDKKAFLTRNGIALYDVIESCSIVGSADSSIEDVEVTDLRPILKVSKVGSRIFTNGAKAHEMYVRYQLPRLEMEDTRLPSTSPANAAMSLEELIRVWGELIGRI